MDVISDFYGKQRCIDNSKKCPIFYKKDSLFFFFSVDADSYINKNKKNQYSLSRVVSFNFLIALQLHLDLAQHLC